MRVSLLSAILATANIVMVQASPMLSQRDDYNIAQIRLWAMPDCPGGVGNLGEWTVRNETGDVNTCHALPSFATGEYLSIAEQQASSDPGWANCTTTLYTDSACTLSGTVLALNACENAPAGSEGWASFEVAC